MNKNKKERLLKEFKASADNPEFFAREGEAFKGDKHCIIWTGAEEWAYKDKIGEDFYEVPIADYYDNYEGHKRFNEFCEKNKLHWEWYDPGTIMIYEE